MADSHLEAIAADARRRGWATSWHDTPARIELIVVPTISNPEQQGFLGLGFGVTLGGSAVACWVWEAWTGSLIDPWQESGPAGGPMFQELPLEQEPQRFHLVASLEQALPAFDRAARRYMATMRQMALGLDPMELSHWADLEPIAGGRGDG
jgi:hypothetical protein